MALQQGRPDEDFDVAKRGAGEGSETVPTVDALMMDSALEGSSVPWADLLERFLVYGVIGRRMYETWLEMRDFLSAGLLDISPVITHRLPLEEFEQGIEAMKSGEAAKVVLDVA